MLKFIMSCVCLWACALLINGCGPRTLDGPPDLRLGRDECAECGMLINEDRCSSAFVVEVQDVQEYAMFDDIGCMLDFEHWKQKPGNVIRGYVHDHTSRAWVPAHEAHFVFANPDTLQTPMGSGIVAFGTRAAADECASRHAGEVLNYERLTKARRAWMEARFGKGD